MKNGTLIAMNRPDRLRKKARAYLADMQAFLADTSAAVSVLLDALPHADTALKLKILPLLGYAGKDRVLWPIFQLMMADSTDETVRRAAAIQLGLAASLSDDPSALKAELIENLNHAHPSVRSNSALALGWEGNWPAVQSLIAHLPDPDADVQSAVVSALSSVGDARVFDILTARLESAALEEQRSILLNLWRFAEQNSRVEAVYLDCLDRIAPDLRLDALSALAMIPLSRTILNSYRHLLADDVPRIRRQVVENLFETDPADYDALKATLHTLLADKDAQVRQAVIRLLAKR